MTFGLSKTRFQLQNQFLKSSFNHETASFLIPLEKQTELVKATSDFRIMRYNSPKDSPNSQKFPFLWQKNNYESLEWKNCLGYGCVFWNW